MEEAIVKRDQGISISSWTTAATLTRSHALPDASHDDRE